MNVEELKQLKAELVDNFKYVIVPELICVEPNEASEPKTKKEILSEVNTDEFIKQCGEVFEDTVRYLLSKEININSISLPIWSSGIVCSSALNNELADLTKQWRENFDMSKQIANKWTKTFRQGLKIQTLPEIVPIQIRPILGCYEDFISIKELEEFEENHMINGLVNFEEFVSKIQSLGFNLTCYENYEPLNTYDDYIKALYINGDTEICLSIFADLQLENNKQKTKSHTR